MKPSRWDKAQAAAAKAQRERAEYIMGRVGKNHAIADIARDLNVSRQAVSRIVQKERSRAR